MPAARIRFEPAMFSHQELHFLLENLEKPPVVIREMPVPAGVVRNTVVTAIAQCYELQEKFIHQNVPWAGYDLVRESIERMLNWYSISAELQRRGGPAHPSMHAWDGSRYFPRGIDADSTMVKTEILADGSRRPLGLDLNVPSGQAVHPGLIGAAPWLEKRDGHTGQLGADLLASTPADLIVAERPEMRTGVITCPICDWSESYNMAQGVSAKNQAMMRMRKHLKHAKLKKDQHVILYGRITKKSIAA